MWRRADSSLNTKDTPLLKEIPYVGVVEAKDSELSEAQNGCGELFYAGVRVGKDSRVACEGILSRYPLQSDPLHT